MQIRFIPCLIFHIYKSEKSGGCVGMVGGGGKGMVGGGGKGMVGGGGNIARGQ